MVYRAIAPQTLPNSTTLHDHQAAEAGLGASHGSPPSRLPAATDLTAPGSPQGRRPAPNQPESLDSPALAANHAALVPAADPTALVRAADHRALVLASHR